MRKQEIPLTLVSKTDHQLYGVIAVAFDPNGRQQYDEVILKSLTDSAHCEAVPRGKLWELYMEAPKRPTIIPVGSRAINILASNTGERDKLLEKLQKGLLGEES